LLSGVTHSLHACVLLISLHTCQVWTDYSTLGYSLLLSPDKVIAVEPDRVTIKGGETFGCVDCQVRVVS
jgi:hypothetical protein